MIDYTLALQLKNAGFKTRGHFGVTPKNLLAFNDSEYGWVAEETGDYNTDDLNKAVEIPTLSELVEACGDKFVFLWKSTTGWVAGDGRVRGDWTTLANEQYQEAEGSTPEEAVCALWLALDKTD